MICRIESLFDSLSGVNDNVLTVEIELKCLNVVIMIIQECIYIKRGIKHIRCIYIV